MSIIEPSVSWEQIKTKFEKIFRVEVFGSMELFSCVRSKVCYFYVNCLSGLKVQYVNFGHEGLLLSSKT